MNGVKCVVNKNVSIDNYRQLFMLIILGGKLCNLTENTTADSEIAQSEFMTMSYLFAGIVVVIINSSILVIIRLVFFGVMTRYFGKPGTSFT